MKTTTTHFHRRQLLRGAGIACFLPYLEIMADFDPTPPLKKACFYYTPNGVSLPPEGSKERKIWSWKPLGEGKNYRTTKVLEPLNAFRKDITVLGGLSHPASRDIGAHGCMPYWLKGGEKMSVDQVIAEKLSPFTRYQSLTISVDGGSGNGGASRTLSFDRNGDPIPSESSPRDILNRFFSVGKNYSKAKQLDHIKKGKKNVDLLKHSAQKLNDKLGKSDQHRLSDYLDSISYLEDRITRLENWIHVPFPETDIDEDKLDIDPKVPGEHAKAIADLMTLGFQADLAPAMTYLFGIENGAGLAEKYPAKLFNSRGHHGLSHDTSTGSYERWGRYDQWVAEQFGYFLNKMKSTEDREGSLLDNTIILFGSSQSIVHTARDLPLILAGGHRMGLRHGQLRNYNEADTPMENLFVSICKALGVDRDQFGDSTGALPGDLFG